MFFILYTAGWEIFRFENFHLYKFSVKFFWYKWRMCNIRTLLLCLHWANVMYWYGSVRFGTVINYSVNCTVPYRTVLGRFTRKRRTGAVRYGTVRYGTVRYARQWQCKHSIN